METEHIQQLETIAKHTWQCNSHYRCKNEREKITKAQESKKKEQKGKNRN